MCLPCPHLQVSTTTTFYCSAGAGIVGAIITWIFLPDTTGLDLAEIDRYHRFMLAGQVGAVGVGSAEQSTKSAHPLAVRAVSGRCRNRCSCAGWLTPCRVPGCIFAQTKNYHGPAVKPKHLSLYERWRGYGACLPAGWPPCMRWQRAGGLCMHAAIAQLPPQSLHAPCVLTAVRHWRRFWLPLDPCDVPAFILQPDLPSWRDCCAGKHYDERLDAQQRKLQDMAAEQEEWEQQPTSGSEK